MKKKFLPFLAALVVALAACANASPAAPTAAASVQTLATAAPTIAGQDASASMALNTDYENAVPIEMQLLAGTLSLTGDLALSQYQASELLPLWTELRDLSLSMGPGAPGQASAATQPDATEAQTQINALVEQIQAAMTPPQIEAIAAMQITQDAVMAIMQAQGMAVGGANGEPPQGGQPRQGASSGNPPGGQAPAGGQPPSNGAQPGSGPMAGGMIPPELFDALIGALGGDSSTTEAAPAVSAPAATSGAATTTSAAASAAYSQSGGSETRTGETYTASKGDESAIYLDGGGVLTLTGATITTSGDTSSADDSSFHGLNAAVLATGGSTINLSGSTIATTGAGANGAFATEAGSTVNLANVTIKATGDGGHAVMATNGGVMALTEVDMDTAGAHAGAIATDRGGGTITVSGGAVTTSGQDSPGIYSTGDISVADATISATGAESAVIEGANSITLVDTDLSSSLADKWGVMIYQSMSGDAEGAQGVFTMTGGSLANTAKTGPLFYVNNSTGVITLKGVDVTAASGVLVDASANSRWGAAGSNGGRAVLTAVGQTLIGDLTADAISTITATLQNGSTLTGAIDAAGAAQEVNLTLDASSTWTVTADSHLTCLSDPDGISGGAVTNIIGNGHTVTYDASACPALDAKTYTLSGGGELKPAA